MNDASYYRLLEELIVRARTDFLTYFHLFNPQVADNPIKLSRLHRFLIRLVQKVYDKQAHPLQMVSVPPQHGKSTILAIEAGSWVVAQPGETQIALTGFSHALVTKHSKAIRARMEHPLYQRIFPGVLPVAGSNRMDEWDASNGSGVVARSAGSKLTGRRVDWLLMDDLYAGRAEAESPAIRQKVIDWYFADCCSRIHPRSVQWLIGTRWHPEDLIGYLSDPKYVEELQQQGQMQVSFHKTNIEAVCEDVETDPLGRSFGEAAFPEVRPLSFLSGMKALMPLYEWESQFQGRPMSMMESQTDISRIQFLNPDQIPWERIGEVVRGWDTAVSEKNLADSSSGVLLSLVDGQAPIILDVIRRKANWQKLKPIILENARVDREGMGKSNGRMVARLGIEGVSGFQIGVSEVRSALLGEVLVEMRNPPPGKEGGGSKLLRATPWLTKLEKGQFYVVRGPWTNEYIEELRRFPSGPHDDQVDATSVAFEMLTKKKKLLCA